MKRIYPILIIAFLIFLGCRGKEVRPSADSLLAQNAIDVIKAIKDAYEKKNDMGIKEKTDAELSEAILKDLTFKEASLSLTIRMVRITDSDVRVKMNWAGQWHLDEKMLSDRGMATFVLQRQTMKLLRIEGVNPFLIPHL